MWNLLNPWKKQSWNFISFFARLERVKPYVNVFSVGNTIRAVRTVHAKHVTPRGSSVSLSHQFVPTLDPLQETGILFNPRSRASTFPSPFFFFISVSNNSHCYVAVTARNRRTPPTLHFFHSSLACKRELRASFFSSSTQYTCSCSLIVFLSRGSVLSVMAVVTCVFFSHMKSAPTCAHFIWSIKFLHTFIDIIFT
jgi:hypothetical protein